MQIPNLHHQINYKQILQTLDLSSNTRDINMGKDKIFTGVKIAQQMSKARNILNSQVIPREELYQIREREGRLSQELIKILQKYA